MAQYARKTSRGGQIQARNEVAGRTNHQRQQVAVSPSQLITSQGKSLTDEITDVIFRHRCQAEP
jgi:uncharacterized protein YecA (UPF0149 family)